MDSARPHQLAPPDRSRSLGPGPTPQNLMEDTDLSTTRKRPRLDSGERSYRSMSADRAQQPTPQLLRRHGSINQTTTSLPTVLPTASTGAARSPITPSNVTLNLRDAVSAPEGSSAASYDVSRDPEQSTSKHVANGISISPDAGDASEIVSVTSSPMRSPEIEVADPEDFDEEPVHTRWRPLGGTDLIEAKTTQEQLLLEFPGLERYSNLHKALTSLTNVVEKQDLSTSQVLGDVASWIIIYLEATASLKAHWYDLVSVQRDFWDGIPIVMQQLLRRSDLKQGHMRLTIASRDESNPKQNPLHEFLMAYTALTLRMTHVDQQSLEEFHEDFTLAPDLVSDSYLVFLAHCWAPNANLWKATVDTAYYDIAHTRSAMIRHFAFDSIDGVRCITEKIKRQNFHQDAVWASSSVVFDVLQYYRTCPMNQKPKSDDLPGLAFEFFEAVDTKVKTQVEKQLPALSISACSSIIPKLYSLLLYICVASDEITAICLQKLVPEAPTILLEDRPWLAYYAMKFELFRQCIMEGRMEIRVFGVDSMQSELVEFYSKYNNKSVYDQELADYPIALYLSNWMLANRLVEYLVGADSHPQIITRSSNIIGFLIVTHKYSEAETDIIWNAVANGQDLRQVEAILRMLHGIFDISSFPVLMYLVQKLNDLPLQNFHGHMMEHAKHLLKAVRDKKRTVSDRDMALPPYHVCLRLIRECSSDVSLGLQRRQEMRQWAGYELRCMLDYGPAESQLTEIYHDCLAAIRQHTTYATGSVFAINCFLGHPRTTGHVRTLAHDSSLMKLLIDNLISAIGTRRYSGNTVAMVDESLSIHLLLLQQLIFLTPKDISYELAQEIWEVTVGSSALNDAAREQAWAALMAVMHNSAEKEQQNSFIDICIERLLPDIQPCLVVHHSLVFACAVNAYHSRTVTSSAQDLKGTTSVDLLWRLSLAIPEGNNELETRSINMLIGQYLDSPEAQRRSRSESDSVHILLAARCIHQLQSAASALMSFKSGQATLNGESMVITASDKEVETQRVLFKRSLRILAAFVQMIRERPMYSPEPQPTPQLPKGFSEIKGDAIKFMYQAFSGRSNTEIRTIEVGGLETRADLAARLRLLTGFPNFTVIAGGKPIEFTAKADEQLKDADLHQKGLLLIKRTADANAAGDISATYGLRPVEIEIMAHFADLYELLALEEGLADQVYSFLCAFPPHQTIITLVCTQNTLIEEAFPLTVPFKMLYSTFVLKRCLSHHYDNDAAARQLNAHAIHILTAAIIRSEFKIDQSSSKADISVAAALVECLTAFMKEPAASSENAVAFVNPSQLVDRLHCWTTAGSSLSHVYFEAKLLVDQCFAALLEASMQSGAFRASFIAAARLPMLLQRLLLEESGPLYQKETALMMEGTCCNNQKNSTAPGDLIRYLWESIMTIIPRCLDCNGNTQYFFATAQAFLLATIQHEERIPALNVDACFPVWCDMLLKLKQFQNVGSDETNWTLIGLARLIHTCIRPSRPLSKPPDLPDEFMIALFRMHLFPDIDASKPSPSLHSNEREELLGIVLALSHDQTTYQELVHLMRDLIPEDEGSQAWSWGFAQPIEEYQWEPCFSIEKSKIMRSSSGYAGLRNLTNTCYMNSLLAQLFMNIKFRSFVFGTTISDEDGAQRLLHETKYLFSYLQGTYQKAVNTQGVVDSLVTYDNTTIDVTIQMDVDEFYNLLFDRWESQIIGDQERRTFKSFYGGQIVQQIKSKECIHVSERLEPFSAIQCDITGKTSLIESLEAYVSGETMEGDNKYSCTSCGNYVDAVKRACFKDIPDNLIFHLKRFDYDLMTGQRSKINSRFEFPKEVDMAPYHVNNLTSSDGQASPDVFTLVGVLVHSGTAESGHYYSYIQQRNPTKGYGPWLEFNDTEVTWFEPENIDDQCFGGYVDATTWAPGYVKIWNAYMLFYERIDTKTVTDMVPSATTPLQKMESPEIPGEFHGPIELQNAEFLRRYCLFDDAQTVFTIRVLELLRNVFPNGCAEGHYLEREAIEHALEYLDRVLSRSKGCPRHEDMIAVITAIITSCPQCCKLALQWLARHESVLRNLLLRCPVGGLRSGFAGMVLKGLMYLRDDDPDNINSYEGPSNLYESIFSSIASCLKHIMQYLHLSSKSWDDFFGLVLEMGYLGISERHMLLAKGFLQSCMAIVLVEDHSARVNLRLGYSSFVRLLEKGRKFSMGKLTDLIAVLLEGIDLHVRSVDAQVQDRPLMSNLVPLTELEDDYIRFGSRQASRTKPVCVFLERILNVNGNIEGIKLIVRKLVLAEPKFGMLGAVRTAIQSGISVDPASQAGPALQAALVFCECVPTPKAAENMIIFVCQEMDSIGKSGGLEHLQFFNDARRLRNIRLDSPDLFIRLVRSQVHIWAPPLLGYVDEVVRLQTIELLRILLFRHNILEFDDEEEANEIMDAGKRLGQACAGKCADKLQASKQIESPKLWEQTIEVARHCVRMYFPEDEETAIVQIEHILDSMEALSVSDLEDGPSDNWVNSGDELPSESESEFESHSR